MISSLKPSSKSADNFCMKVFISVVLLFFSPVALSFIKGLPYKKTKVCKQIMTNYSEAITDLKKDSAAGNIHKSFADLQKAFVKRNKIYGKRNRALDDSLKYKCFKQTPACIQSIKDYSKAVDDKTKARTEIVRIDISTAISNMKKAVADIKKHCW